MLVELYPLSVAPAEAIEALLDAAFGADRFGRTAYRLRAGCRAIPALSFAAMRGDALVGGALVGTVQSWPVAHRDASGRVTPLVMVGPVAVCPDAQGCGVGQQLMAALVTAAESVADGALMMIGDPDYYGRFWAFRADATAHWALPGPVEPPRLLSRPANGHCPPVSPGVIVPDANRIA